VLETPISHTCCSVIREEERPWRRYPACSLRSHRLDKVLGARFLFTSVGTYVRWAKSHPASVWLSGVLSERQLNGRVYAFHTYHDLCSSEAINQSISNRSFSRFRDAQINYPNYFFQAFIHVKSHTSSWLSPSSSRLLVPTSEPSTGSLIVPLHRALLPSSAFAAFVSWPYLNMVGRGATKDSCMA